MTAPLLEVRAVVKNFGGLHVLRGVDLALEAGELRCIIGPNGCGKTTLFNVISGAFAPTSGHVLFDGDDITGRSPHLVSRLGIVAQVSGAGHLPLAGGGGEPGGPAAAPRGHRRPLAVLRAGARAAPRLRALLERFGLRTQRGAPGRGAGARAEAVAGDRHADRQRTPSSCCSTSRPPACPRRRPTATVELIRRIQHEHGVAVLVIEHDMSFVRQLGCPVSVMIRGAVRFAGSYAQVQAHPEVREAYLGQAAR